VPRASVAAVVLAGGSARRFGADKLEAPAGAGRLLDRAVAAAEAAVDGPVVLVGPARTGLPATLRVVREDPPGTGPVAALAAGLDAAGDVDVVLVLAGDLLAPAPALPVLRAALEAAPDHDAAVLVDADDRRQPLLAAYRVLALRRALASAPVAGRPLREVLGQLRVLDVPDAGGWSTDVDVPEDLRESP
jgi:molybdopterin-guanine dinucleotide biosynthesis protein A